MSEYGVNGSAPYFFLSSNFAFCFDGDNMDFLTALRSTTPRTPITINIGDGRYNFFVQYPDDATLIIYNEIITSEQKRLFASYNRNPAFSKPITPESWSESDQKIWGEKELPSSLAEYRSHVDAMRTAVVGVIHLILRDEQGNHVVDPANDADVLALQSAITYDTDAMLSAMVALTKFIIHRNEVFKKKSQKVQQET